MVAVFVVAAVVAAMAGLARRSHPFLPALVLVAVNWLLQVVDVALGSRLQLNTPFGYSPIVAGRFQGFGNLAFAILAASALVVATGRWVCGSGVAGRRRGRRRDAEVIPWLGSRNPGLTFLVDGLPSMGADVGGVLATVPAFALVLVLLAGWRVQHRQGGHRRCGPLPALAALALLDLSAPSRAGRTWAVRQAPSTGTPESWSNASCSPTCRSSPRASGRGWCRPASPSSRSWHPSDRLLHRLQRRVPGVRACLLGALVVGTLGLR